MGDRREITEGVHLPFFETLAPGYGLEVGYFEPQDGALWVHLIWTFAVKSSGRSIAKNFPKRLKVGDNWYSVVEKKVLYEKDKDDGSLFLRATLRVEADSDRALREGSKPDKAEIISFADRA